MRHDPEVRQAASQYQLGLPQMPSSGRSGELLGRGTGSSLEFQEYREYLPGDDIRHVDWSTYARTDALMVRLYREEISPRMEILLDLSKSMTTGDGQKARLALQIASLLAVLSGQVGGQPRILLLDDSRPVSASDPESLDHLSIGSFTATGTIPDLLTDSAIPLKRQSVRVVISDFLFPHDPDLLVRRLAGDASAFRAVQVLTAFESDPEAIGGRRLVDAETEGEADLVINRQTIVEYKQRLGRLQSGLQRACRRVASAFVPCVAESGLSAVARTELSGADLLRPI